jgi:hypothetical protein
MVLCMREPSDKPVASGGWLHGESNVAPPPPKPRPTLAYEPPTFDAPLWFGCVRRVQTEALLAPWADRLGLPVAALDVMGAGVLDEMLTFPMRDGHGRVCGIRTRNLAGEKKALTGSKAGVFIPPMPPDNEVLVCEGPTDATAVLALGYWPIGRPSCLGCERHVADTCKRFGVDRVTICSDADGPGLAGARKLADILQHCRIKTRMVTPCGHKDLRDWYRAKVQRAQVDLRWSQAEWSG